MLNDFSKKLQQHSILSVLILRSQRFTEFLLNIFHADTV